MTDDAANSIAVPSMTISKLPELKENPFGGRILKIFSQDGTGNLTFNDFLNMFSVFSEKAPRELKSFYAFRIYDFNSDGYLSHSDLLECLKLLTGAALTSEEASTICDKIMEETDIDDDGKLSFMEFDHVISRSPDFLNNFHIRI